MTTPKVLPADAFDTLELSAWAYGGIGAGSYWDAAGLPLCVYGHGADATDGDLIGNPVACAFGRFMGSVSNDLAVHSINLRHGNALNARVPFNKWCAELNIVRGD